MNKEELERKNNFAKEYINIILEISQKLNNQLLIQKMPKNT